MHWTHRLDRGPHGGPKEVLWRLSHHNQEQLGSAVALSCFHFWATASLAAQSGPCASARLGVRGAPSRICCPLPCPPRSRATPRRAWNLTLESRSDQTGEPAIEEVEEGRNKYLQKAGSKDSRFMHPDDSHSALWGAGESELAGPCVAIVSRIMINFRLLAVLRLASTLVRNHRCGCVACSTYSFPWLW